MKRPMVSVVCPNHGRDITQLSSQVPDHFEFIEVNEGLERSAQRNIGIKKAKGKYLLILDSDQTISTHLIEECLVLASQGYETLYIPEIIIGKSFFSKVRAFERCFYTGTAVDVPRFVRRVGCPLFNEDLIGPEDADWGNRLPEKRAITENFLFHHDDISFKEYCEKKKYYSKSMDKYAKLWPLDPVLSLRYRCWQVFTERGRWKNLLLHPILTLGIIFILITRGVIYYANRG